jgi:hypothetical protein
MVYYHVILYSYPLSTSSQRCKFCRGLNPSFTRFSPLNIVDYIGFIPTQKPHHKLRAPI